MTGTTRHRLLGAILSLAVALTGLVVAAPMSAAADTRPPSAPRVSLDRWLTPKKVHFSGTRQWRPRATWTAARDDRRVSGYQVQVKFPGGRWHRPHNRAWRSPDRLRYRGVVLNPGEQMCLRVRARDQAGNVSAWSKRRCTSAPLVPLEDFDHDRTIVRDSGAGTHPFAVVSKRNKAVPRTDARVSGVRGVRVSVRTGPSSGRMKVYVGKRYLGTVDARSSTTRWRGVKLTIPADQARTGRLRFVPVTKKPVKVRFVWPIG
ncbi:hypothetical protein [Isoptericola halotolerans]|uniref:Fibronectin type-III domain-containing protein n=1 Tax=Isoptericola halotolerans TaxID=300560 RepID=A0ABX2A888_9MICO|nr:hypothetical protein [Isoptericola halotolerans]NOV98989.1 hypothetical protein [Isoptericola halotolerans]